VLFSKPNVSHEQVPRRSYHAKLDKPLAKGEGRAGNLHDRYCTIRTVTGPGTILMQSLCLSPLFVSGSSLLYSSRHRVCYSGCRSTFLLLIARLAVMSEIPVLSYHRLYPIDYNRILRTVQAALSYTIRKGRIGAYVGMSCYESLAGPHSQGSRQLPRGLIDSS